MSLGEEAEVLNTSSSQARSAHGANYGPILFVKAQKKKILAWKRGGSYPASLPPANSPQSPFSPEFHEKNETIYRDGKVTGTETHASGVF